MLEFNASDELVPRTWQRGEPMWNFLSVLSD